MIDKLEQLAKLVRYYILVSTSKAGSGHPTSSLSAADLLTVLFFNGYFRQDFDKFILSKGHASPLLYSIYTTAGKITEEELLSLRQFDSKLEGHPTPRFPYVDVATGSLGQGLSIGVGMALVINNKFQKTKDKIQTKSDDQFPISNIQFPNIFVLLGDSEMAEGQVWEAIQLASYYQLNNLIGIIDVNRLGQRGETMLGHDVFEYEKRISSFGWDTIVVDGHNLDAINNAYNQITTERNKPLMIIAKTVKGKGISFLDDQENWHGKTLSETELKLAIEELGQIDFNIRGEINKSESVKFPNQLPITNYQLPKYKKGDKIATRKAYGEALTAIAEKYPEIVSLDAEVSNSTYSEIFKQKYPDRFFEMFIAEQNMVSVALGMSKSGKIPFVSTFAAFLTRAFDQIRMSQYSMANIKFVGSHAGISIGADGPSQMGLEDIACFRSILNSVILYPADALATSKLIEKMAEYQGIVYLRTTRAETEVIYDDNDDFYIGGSKTLKSSSKDKVTVVTAGITLYQVLDAYQQLQKDGISIRVIDLYSIKPLDNETLLKAAKETQAIITVEDHYPAGGIGEAVS